MFRLWAKQWKNNRMIQDAVICRETEDTRTHKIFGAVTEVCDDWDLCKPIWLDANIEEFKRIGKTRFSQDNFIEDIAFDYLEIHIIEE